MASHFISADKDCVKKNANTQSWKWSLSSPLLLEDKVCFGLDIQGISFLLWLEQEHTDDGELWTSFAWKNVCVNAWL